MYSQRSNQRYQGCQVEKEGLEREKEKEKESHTGWHSDVRCVHKKNQRALQFVASEHIRGITTT